jgi:hypothetical protein
MADLGNRTAAPVCGVRSASCEDGPGLADVKQHCLGRIYGTLKNCFQPKADMLIWGAQIGISHECLLLLSDEANDFAGLSKIAATILALHPT